jgi:hypothetical protein
VYPNRDPSSRGPNLSRAAPGYQRWVSAKIARPTFATQKYYFPGRSSSLFLARTFLNCIG